MFNLLHKLLNILKTLKSLNGLIHNDKMAVFFWLSSLFRNTATFQVLSRWLRKVSMFAAARDLIFHGSGF